MATYYVRTDGSNSNAGTANTAGGAWLTIAYSESQIVAGDTVRVQEGTYNERITVTPGGSAGNYKTFVADGLVTCRGFTISGVSYIKIIGFDITHTSTTYSNAVSLSGTCSYIEILDCNIYNIYKDGIQALNQSATSYVTVRDCSFSEIGYIAGIVDEDTRTPIVTTYIKPDTSQGLTSDHWLVEYCTFTDNIDVFHLYGAYHVARNNVIVRGREPLTIHPDVFQSGSDGCVAGTAYHIVEANLGGNMLDGDSHFGIWQDVQGDGSWSGDTNFIIRGNVIFNIGAGAIGSKNTPYVLTYNNTLYKITQTTAGNVLIFYKGSGDVQYPDYAMVANTIVMDDGATTDALSIQSGTTGGVLTNNLGYQAGSESSYVSTSDPLFTDATSEDFSLQSGSPARAAGASLTTISSATGSGTSFDVTKSYLFSAGNGLVDGDLITVGATTTKITGISGNTITTAASVSWTQNDPVYWGFSSTIDIGALPYTYAVSFTVVLDNTSLPAGSNNLTTTVSNANPVRKVGYFVDGVPVGESYDSPYTVAYTADGGTHTVEARAYKRYASATPTISHTRALTASGAARSRGLILTAV